MSKNLLRKFFNWQAWGAISIFFSFALAISFVGEGYIKENEDNINYALGINPYEKVEGQDGGDSTYFPSDFYKEDGKTFDDVKMRANSMKVSREAAADGAVLLKNENNALPLAEGGKISFFGVSSRAKNWMYTGLGSGSVSVTTSDFPDLKATFESEGKYSVNPSLYNTYSDTRAWKTLSNPFGDDNHYREFQVNEKAWSSVNSAAGDSFASYGDAAIFLISRTGAEDGDTWFDTSKNTTDEHIDNDYLNLTKNEKDALDALIALKNSGTFKKVILVINSGTPLTMKDISKLDLDAILWAGMGGNASFGALYDVMSGKVNPSGKLVDTYAYNPYSAPSMMNTGAYEFSRSGALPAENRSSNSYNHSYIVYQEGIYVGYRYYETRYEDTIINQGNAKASAGVVNGSGEWNYSSEVCYPFGYGLSYTKFEYKSANFKKVGDDFEMSVEVKNVGSTKGKTSVQVYLQKPYTEYDKANKIEKASVELVGYAKTPMIDGNGSATVTVKIDGSELKTYDSYNAKTYILEKGDYYFSIGENIHDSLNNILSKKGYSSGDGLKDQNGDTVSGNDKFAFKYTVARDDFEKYSVSKYTGKKVTNRFDDTDINLYEGTKNQTITYLSRSDWGATYPKTNVKMIATNAKMVADMQYVSGIKKWEDENAKMPTYGTTTFQGGALTLAMLKGLPFDNPYWENLLDQLTWEETINLCGKSNHLIQGVNSISSPSVVAQDGPAGVKVSLTKEAPTLMAFPSGVLLASTFDDAIVEKVMDAFGLEMLHSGCGEIYGTGAGIHRSVYGGRNWEYFSEDGYLSGRILKAEVVGLQKRGAIVNIKHLVLNDQEIYRCGVATWCNEQALREIYLKAFEAAVTEGKANGIMSSLNRLGCTWVGRHKGLLTDVLRTEWGFEGFVETDSATGLYMRLGDARAEAVIAGNDLWLRGSTDTTELWGDYKDNPTVATALRQAAHRILYVVANSAAMNGVTTSTRFVYNAPWYYDTIHTVQIVSCVLTGISVLATAYAVVLAFKRKKSM